MIIFSCLVANKISVRAVMKKGGMIDVKDVFNRAKEGDVESISSLFNGFLGDDERIKDCGYLGVLGYIFPEYSFWCITDRRVCGLLIRRGGRLQFTSGFIKLINSLALRQPSLVTLWVTISIWMIVLWFIGSQVSVFFLIMYGVPEWVSFLVPLALGILAIRWIIRIYYRFVKSGCIFWMREKLPIYLFADRNNLANAQKLISRFQSVKRETELV